jgi:hypothetical protein
MRALEMLTTHPEPTKVDDELLREAIEALVDCAQTCTTCADACLAEDGVGDLRGCIRTDLDCADICATTARVLARRGERDDATVEALVRACETACRSCAAECEQHADHHEHCRICAEACRRCADACAALLAAS